MFKEARKFILRARLSSYIIWAAVGISHPPSVGRATKVTNEDHQVDSRGKRSYAHVMPNRKDALPHARTMEATDEEIDVESLDEDEEMPPLRLSSSSSSFDEDADSPASMIPIVSVDMDVEEEESLATLKIRLLDEPLRQHKIETMAGTRVLSKKQFRAFEKIIPMKRGKFSIREDARLTKNWRNFCTVHNWSPKNTSPFMMMRSENGTYLMPKLEERRKFVQFLAKDLKNRSLYSVYNRFKKLCNQPEKSGRFTKREDDTILRNLSLGAAACSTSAKDLKRDKLSIRHRTKRVRVVKTAGKELVENERSACHMDM